VKNAVENTGRQTEGQETDRHATKKVWLVQQRYVRNKSEKFDILTGTSQDISGIVEKLGGVSSRAIYSTERCRI
jgi:hypothetical protein